MRGKKNENRQPYFGSVRFFKHLIYSVILVVFFMPVFISIGLKIDNVRLSDKINRAIKSADMAVSPVTDGLDGHTITDATENPSYQSLYPDLYVKSSASASVVSDKTVYLSFDDGPSKRTPEILKVLKENDVKATFFVVGTKSSESLKYMKQIVSEGHTIGVHSYSHQYKTIYSSVESYLKDFYKLFTLIKETTGVEPTVYRFPGGSINSYNRAIYQEIISEMTRRGFVYFDWNVSSGDAAEKTVSKDTLIKGATAKLGKLNRPLILMHDSVYKKTTVEALGEIISTYRKSGYSFDRLTADIKPITFGYLSYERS